MIPTLGYAASDATSPLAPYRFDRRDPGPRDVRIRIQFCGVCHSDLHYVRGEWGDVPYPAVPGHEIVGRVVAVGDAVTRHHVRIRAKKLRYMLEPFGAVGAGARFRRMLDELKTLQDALGALNDERVARETLEAFAREALRDGADDPAPLFAAGLVAGERHADHDALIAEAQAARDRLKDVEPFWSTSD